MNLTGFSGFARNPITYLPPSAGDIEEARVKRLLDLAQLNRYQSESDFQQEQNRLGWAKLQDDRQGRLDSLLNARRDQEINLRAQDVQQRGQDQATMDKREEMKSTRLGDLMRVYGAQPNADMNILGATMAASGMPEFQTVLQANAGKLADAKVAQAYQEYSNLKPGAAQDTYLKAKAIENPEVAAGLRAHLTRLASAQTNAAIPIGNPALINRPSLAELMGGNVPDEPDTTGQSDEADYSGAFGSRSIPTSTILQQMLPGFYKPGKVPWSQASTFGFTQ